MNLDELIEVNNEPDYFTVLGVDPSSTIEQIDAEFRLKARTIHPDKNASNDANRQFQLLNRAREVLTNPKLREDYKCWFNSGLEIQFERWLAVKDHFQTCMHWSFGPADRGQMLTSHEDKGFSTKQFIRQTDSGDILRRFRNYQI
ncbi:hypothetical protein FBUS_03321 [Fasciolopsis buskii]|uniref:J domain-containing protein n=1 Tax=Fasciolopsis buskii TaxID=27845 RepID=A0A8E0RWA6_9TREM|nr:hypothetical protein FBUS_03321 [Fasciolopsis buski]